MKGSMLELNQLFSNTMATDLYKDSRSTSPAVCTITLMPPYADWGGILTHVLLLKKNENRHTTPKPTLASILGLHFISLPRHIKGYMLESNQLLHHFSCKRRASCLLDYLGIVPRAGLEPASR